MRAGRLVVVAIAGLAVVGAAGAAALTVRDNVQDQQACETMRQQAAGSFQPISVDAGDTPVTVLGDSYAGAYFLPEPEAGWAHLAAEEAGWDATIAAVGSTGFVNESACGDDSFAQRASTFDGSELVIIQGGVNDFKQDPSEVGEAAVALIGAAPEDARVIVVGPANTPARPEVESIDAALAEALAGTRAEYVSAIGWELEYLPDNLHLTEDGHARFADQVLAAL